MQLDTTAATAERECPIAYRRICDRFAKSKAGKAGGRVEDLHWHYRWGETINNAPAKPRTADVAVADRLKRIGPQITLVAGRHSELVAITPSVIAYVDQWTRDRFNAALIEEARQAALSPEERSAELQDVLAQLIGTPGFMAIRVSDTALRALKGDSRSAIRGKKKGIDKPR